MIGAGTVQGLGFSSLLSNMSELYKMKWVFVRFQGNPAHLEQRTYVGVEAGCIFTCHHTTTGIDEAAEGRR